MSHQRVVVAHDYLTQRGGAERVALALVHAFPGARLVTSCWEPHASFADFVDVDIETLWPNRVGLLRKDPRKALPVLAPTFSLHTVTDADVVVCSSSGWAHGIRSAAPKVVYCHNPARWLHQPVDYFPSLGHAGRTAFYYATRPLMSWDRRAAGRAHTYVANSTSVARRIRETYGIEALVVPPPRGLDPEGHQEPIEGMQPGFLLTVGRTRNYKNANVTCDAVESLPDERLVIVGDLLPGDWSDRITALGSVSDAQLRWLYAHCGALVAVGFEDFGLTVVEAQAFGVPAVVLRGGGYLDSTVEGVTGVFVDHPTGPCVADAISELRRQRWDAHEIRRLGERYSPSTFAKAMTGIVHTAVDTA